MDASRKISAERFQTRQTNKGRALQSVAGIALLLLVSCTAENFSGAFRNTPRESVRNNGFTPSPQVTLQPTASPIPPPLNKLVYRDGTSIFVDDSSGKNSTRLVDDAAFAGYSEGSKVFYYSQLDGTTATVYKKDLAGDAATKLFSFDSSGKNVETFLYNVMVTSDGKYAVFSHNHGNLSLYDLTNGTERVLLNAKKCLTYAGTALNLIRPLAAGQPDCYGYYYPHWSPDNQKIVVRKIFFEGATQVVIDPFASKIQEKDVGASGEPPVWSADSRMLLFPGIGYGPGSLYLITNLDAPVNRDLLAERVDFQGTDVASAALSSEGRAAFSYSAYQGAMTRNGVALFNLKDDSAKLLLTTPVDTWRVQAWLDNQTLVLRDDTNHFWTIDVDTLEKKELPIHGDAILTIIRP